MKAFWVGSTASPSTSATQYNFPVAGPECGWGGTEGDRVVPLSDDVTVTRFKVWVDTAPGAAKSYAFTLRDNSAATSVSATVSGTNLEAEWTGTASLLQLARLSLQSVPSGTPTAPVRVYWLIEYETAGNFYLVPGGCTDFPQDGTFYHPPWGGNGVTPSATTTTYETVCPVGFTVTKIAAYNSITPSGSNTYRVRNNTTPADSTFSCVVSGSERVDVSGTGSFAFAAGDRIVIRQDESGSNWLRHSYCMTIEPATPGDIVMAFGTNATPSTTATEYEGVQGVGDNDWDPTESNVRYRLPACTLKNLRVNLSAAPAAGKSRAFTLRSNASDTSVVATVSDTNTIANSGGNSASHNDGNFVSVKAVPSGTPTAANADFGFVASFSQGLQNTGAFFALF